MRGSGWCPFFNNWHERDARASEGNERNKNGVFDRISDVRLRMSGIAKDSHIENLRLLTIENKLRFI